MSGAAEPSVEVRLPPEWERLERAAEAAVAALETWRARARQAEEEVVRLRAALEQAVRENAAAAPDPREAREQLRHLRAENAALRSRIAQAHRRISVMLAWTDALEGDG